MNNLTHYLVIFFATALFTLIYLKLLKNSVNKVIDGKKSFNYIYLSFVLRFVLAAVFLFCMLKYFNDIREIIIVICTFILLKTFYVRKVKNAERKIIEHKS